MSYKVPRIDLQKEFTSPEFFNAKLTIDQQVEWCIKKDAETNHYYDEYIPYKFHLQMVMQCVKDYIKLTVTKDIKVYQKYPKLVIFDFGSAQCFIEGLEILGHALTVSNSIFKPAGAGHDLIEDARSNYNEVKKQLGVLAAEIIRAVTNLGRGRNRDERMPDFIYEDIRETFGATFIKLCDRMANCQYSKLTKSGMLYKYRKEMPDFIHKILGVSIDEIKKDYHHPYQNLVLDLLQIVEE